MPPNVNKEIGTIQEAYFGMGGYQEVMMGFGVILGGPSWGCGDFIGTWASDPDHSCKWTTEDQDKMFAKATRVLLKTLKESKKKDVAELKGVPIEATFEDGRLKSWRVLTEAIL